MRIALGILSLVMAVAIIAIVASMTVLNRPTIEGSRRAADETAITAMLRTIATAEQSFQLTGVKDQDQDTFGEYGTVSELAGLTAPAGAARPVNPPFLDKTMGAKQQHGYTFDVFVGESACRGLTGTDASEEDYFVTAWPLSHGESGDRTFCLDVSGVIRASDNGGDMAPCSAVIGRDPWPPAGR